MTEDTITVTDLIELAEAHPLLRFELSPEGVIEATMTPRATHNVIIAELMFWLQEHIPDSRRRIVPGTGVCTKSGDDTGLRQPDVMLLSEPPPRGVTYLDPAIARLVVEVVSPSTKVIDFKEKLVEYAAAGIPHYWIVDAKENVWLHRLDPETGRYRPDDTTMIALADLITRDPNELLD